MIAWIWDAPGPDQAGTGITDSEAVARQSAENFMIKAHAPTARIEKVAVVIGLTTLADARNSEGK
jgi:hypothetical protein